jgi:23S rRNA (guanosine2251-2'-O)-methyltransferase
VKRIVAGVRAVTEALRAAPQQISVIYFDESERKSLGAIEELARQTNVRGEPMTRVALDAVAEGLRHQGVIAITGEYPYFDLDAVLQKAPSSPLLIALDQITDPHNFGSIIRSASALGADGIITLKEKACPVTPVVVRTSTGATERIRIARVPNLARALSELSKRHMQIIGLAGEGETEISDLPYPAEGRVLVIGSEGNGLRRLVREHCDVLARISLAGPIESLNASVAAAIALHESARARRTLG